MCRLRSGLPGVGKLVSTIAILIVVSVKLSVKMNKTNYSKVTFMQVLKGTATRSLLVKAIVLKVIDCVIQILTSITGNLILTWVYMISALIIKSRSTIFLIYCNGTSFFSCHFYGLGFARDIQLMTRILLRGNIIPPIFFVTQYMHIRRIGTR